LFLKNVPEGYEDFSAHIKSRLESEGSLSHFKSLVRKDFSWSKESKEITVINSKLPVAQAPKRKRQRLA
jgi:hypothetical protein